MKKRLKSRYQNGAEIREDYYSQRKQKTQEKLSVASKVALIKDCYEVRCLESCGKYSQKWQQEVKRSAWLAAETRLKVFNCQLLLFIMCISVSPPLHTHKYIFIYVCLYTVLCVVYIYIKTACALLLWQNDDQTAKYILHMLHMIFYIQPEGPLIRFFARAAHD